MNHDQIFSIIKIWYLYLNFCLLEEFLEFKYKYNDKKYILTIRSDDDFVSLLFSITNSGFVTRVTKNKTTPMFEIFFNIKTGRLVVNDMKVISDQEYVERCLSIIYNITYNNINPKKLLKGIINNVRKNKVYWEDSFY